MDEYMPNVCSISETLIPVHMLSCYSGQRGGLIGVTPTVTDCNFLFFFYSDIHFFQLDMLYVWNCSKMHPRLPEHVSPWWCLVKAFQHRFNERKKNKRLRTNIVPCIITTLTIHLHKTKTQVKKLV